MNKSTKQFFLKLIIFSTSLITSLIISEVILTKVFQRYQVPQHFNPESSIDPAYLKSLNSKLNQDRHKNIYEIYKAKENNLEIITIGDSYTNGGNVLWNQSYPFQLFLKMDRKIPVSNLGVCEDTTKGSYMRLKNYFETKKNMSMKSIIVVLVGAADMFYDSGPEFEAFYNEFLHGGHISSEKVTLKIEDNLNFWQRFKTFKMMKYVFDTSTKKLSDLVNNYLKDEPLDSILKKCFLAEKEDRKLCFISKYQQIINDPNMKINMRFYKKLTKLIIINNSLGPNGKEEKIIGDLLTAIEAFPGMPGTPEVIYNLVAFTSLQSKYSLKEDILPLLKKYSLLNEKVQYGPDSDKIDQSESIIMALEKWASNYNYATAEQRDYYEKIISLVHQNNSEIIFLTYPLDYKIINNEILKLSQKKNVHVIDIKKIFLDLKSQGLFNEQLIGDWEHCTPLGYEYIAEAVAEKIREIQRSPK